MGRWGEIGERLRNSGYSSSLAASFFISPKTETEIKTKTMESLFDILRSILLVRRDASDI